MERGSRILVFLALFAGLYLFFNKSSSETTERKIQPPVLQLPGGVRPAPAICDIWTDSFRAQVSTRGGVLTSLRPLSTKYREGKSGTELVTTPDHPELGPLFAAFRSEADVKREKDWLVTTDVQDFRLVAQTGRSCSLVADDGRSRIEKTISAGTSPYSLNVTVKVTNLTDSTKPYALSVGTSAYLRDADVKSQMFRMNPRMTHVECYPREGKAIRELPDSFSADSFDEEERFRQNSINSGYWSQPIGKASIVAVSNAYFTDSVAHDDGPVAPDCLLQVDQRWHPNFRSVKDDPDSGAIYKARLAYEPRDLKPGQTETYSFHSFSGPKERRALAAAGEHFEPLIDLGFFSVIAKVLVGYLLWLYEFVPSWGVAIVLLTITARMLLFPLTWPSIKNMVHMRELKPEMDRLNEKYKDDAQAKGLAQMELWKKNGVNPMKGCLPQLISMPVWFALYTTLQTAVELYHIPFLWFPDLSEADPFYILPFIIGAVFFVQQKMMPAQGDPAQQKMMMYFMPAMFTVFMLFLPAGLGVYMFTNSLLGIGQQQLVEIHARRTLQDRKSRVEVMNTPGAKKKNKRS